MDTKVETKAEKPLSEIFEEGWDVFTVDYLDPKTVSVVLENDAAPRNAAHHTTSKSFSTASANLYKTNGEEFFKAISLLERH